jgi:hypothetical protein
MKKLIIPFLALIAFVALSACKTEVVERNPSVHSSTTTTEETRQSRPVQSTTTETQSTRSY